MKIGNVQGTPKEIKNFFKNTGFDIKKYIEPPRHINTKWLLPPGILFLLLMLSLALLKFPNPQIVLCAILLGIISVIWLASAIHIRFNNVWVSVFIALSLPIVLFIASGIIAPIELFNLIKKFTLK